MKNQKRGQSIGEGNPFEETIPLKEGEHSFNEEGILKEFRGEWNKESLEDGGKQGNFN